MRAGACRFCCCSCRCSSPELFAAGSTYSASVERCSGAPGTTAAGVPPADCRSAAFISCAGSGLPSSTFVCSSNAELSSSAPLSCASLELSSPVMALGAACRGSTVAGVSSAPAIHTHSAPTHFSSAIHAHSASANASARRIGDSPALFPIADHAAGCAGGHRDP